MQWWRRTETSGHCDRGIVTTTVVGVAAGPSGDAVADRFRHPSRPVVRARRSDQHTITKETSMGINPGDIDGLFGAIANIVNSLIAGGSSMGTGTDPGAGTGTV